MAIIQADKIMNNWLYKQKKSILTDQMLNMLKIKQTLIIECMCYRRNVLSKHTPEHHSDIDTEARK